MKWFLGIVFIILLLKGEFAMSILMAITYWAVKKTVIPTHSEMAQSSVISPQTPLNLTTGDLADLILLRLELQRVESIDDEQRADLIQHIDALCIRYLDDVAATPDNALWRKRRDAAWDLLNRTADTPLGFPPWHDDIETLQHNVYPEDHEIPITAPPLAVDSTTTALTKQTTATFDILDDTDSLAVQTLQHDVSTEKSQPAVFAIDEADHSDAVFQSVETKKTKPDSFNQYAWKPHEPSRLERALSTLSGWHTLAVPFLVQNIGWFIGVFCFIAGSMFLVSYSTGYVKNLIAFFSFFIFTLALLFGGYQLRHKRSELVASSYVIFILSVLLIPLTTITATQLLISSDGLGLQLLSGLLILMELGVFYYALTLVAGLMDRSLQQRLPQFFLALTAMQLLQLPLIALPFWQVLAVVHLSIFALLSVSIYLFVSQWLQSIFLDQNKNAGFAAGTLIYAALVSFVFVTVGNRIVLPYGYYGFFLMLLSGLLFFVDAQLKQWTEQRAYLSRFSFLVYGLSVLALCLVAQYQTACILTLILTIGLYAFIVISYLTLAPLTIFLGCCFWLYDLLVLQYIPNAGYLLASLPVLLALQQAAKWALNKRQSAHLATIVYRVLAVLLVGLTIWSLSYSEPSLLAMLTAITAGVLIYYALKSAPQALFGNSDSTQNLLNTTWFYSIPLLCAMTVFYAPPLFGLESAAQFSFGLLLLAVAWGCRGVTTFFNAHSTSLTTPIEQRLNSALLSLVVALLPLAAMTAPMRISVLLLAGTILLWLSYQLLARWLFYLVFASYGAGFALLKLTYFPPPSNGMVTALLGIAIWFWLWFIERQERSDMTQLQRDLASQKKALLPTLKVLGVYSLPSSAMLFKDVIHTPMAQLMVLSWLLTMKAVIMRWLAELPSYGWMAAIFLAGLLGGLLIIRYCLIKLLPIPIMLVLTALLMLLQFIGLSPDSLLLVAVLFAITIWQATVYSLSRPFFIRLINALNPLFLQDENPAVEMHRNVYNDSINNIAHNTAFFIVLSSVILQLISSTESHNLMVLFTLLSTAGFLWLSDRSYPQLIVRYWMLGFSVLTAVELIALTAHPLFQWQTLGTDSYAGLLLTLLSLPLVGLSFSDVAVQRLYSKPTSITAIMLAFMAVYLQIVQATNNAVMVITALNYGVLFLAGFSLLIANIKLKWTFCNLTALLVLVLAMLWLESSVLHPHQPFDLWLGEKSSAHSWLVLGLLSFALSLLSHKLAAVQKWTAVYCFPLNAVANLCFGLTLLSTLTLFLATSGQAALLSWLLLVLLLAIFSLSKNWSNAAQLRGFASASLSTLLMFSFLLPSALTSFSAQTITALFGYALWCCASFVLPRFNNRYTNWTITPTFFPLIGFMLVMLSSYWWHVVTNIEFGIYCLELSVYCLLMLRYNRWMGFPWLSAFVFTMAGIVFNIDNENLPINLLLWNNCQLLLVHFWNRKGEKLAERWQWHSYQLALAFELTSQFIFVGYLLVASITFLKTGVNGTNLQNIMPFKNTESVGILLSLSFLHLLWLRFSTVALYSFIYALLLLLWTIYSDYLTSLFHPSVFLALWNMILLVSIYVMSRFVSRYSNEIIAAVINWLRFSLLLATVTLFSTDVTAVDVGIYCLELFAYCVLMLCYSQWLGFSWLAAFTFTAAGIAFNFNSELLSINLLLWGNGQLLLMNFWQRKGEKLAERWQWQSSHLVPAFELTTLFVFISYLLIASFVVSVGLTKGTTQDILAFLPVGMLLSLSFVHLLWLRFSAVALHSFIYSVLLVLWTIYLSYLNTLFHPPLFLALWGVILLALSRVRIVYHADKIAAIINHWLQFSVMLATVALLSYSTHDLGELLLSLAIVAVLSAILGWRSERSIGLAAASIELLLLLHGWVFLWVDVSQFLALLPWYALQTIVFSSLVTWLLTRLANNPQYAEYSELYRNGLRCSSWLILLSLLELGVHGVLFRNWVMSSTAVPWLLPPLDAIAALSTGLIISVTSVRQLRQLPDAKGWYGIVTLLAALGFYSRLLLLGNAPVDLWDTAAIIGSAYILFFLQNFFPSKPLYNTALLMPVLALFTVNIQLASPEISMTLIMTGLLYVLMRRTTGQKMPLYLALIAFNMGVYLWVPSLANSSQLLQIYVIPAALSVLMLLQLHSRELKPSVLMGSRLMAISSIYACATVDVFLRAELGIFILAMVLSIAGILLGIALRTRAFLYAGVSFLLLNVIGQLLRFYPEQGLGKAIVLMVMGATITGLMIWFNMQRVAILQRINAIQAEMQTWQ